MTNQRVNFYPADMESSVQTCRHQHQTWAASLAERELEIDQLLSLLADLLPEEYHSIHHHSVDYALALSRLKNRIHQLRVDVVCTGAHCSTPTPPTVCPDPHFMPSTLGNSLMSAVAVEFGQMKDRCRAFFGELMVLNLI